MTYTIRLISKKDDSAIESVIRRCLIEFGADHEGTAWADPDLCRFSQVYNAAGRRYWVAEVPDGALVGGAGIGELAGISGVCELQKMYCLPEARGSGVSHLLMDAALDFARAHYSRCYLETLENMTAAQRFYEKYGFKRIYEPLTQTGHFACDIRYIKELT